MTYDLQSLIEEWDGLGVLTCHDEPSGAWIFIALHDDTLGPPTGGTRMMVYSSPAEGLRDAMRLAAGMTAKWAAVDLAFGGGKAVLAVPRVLEGEERRRLLLRYGRLVESLHGGFGTGEDLGTTPEDMLVIGSVTSHVHGVDAAAGRSADPGPFTARGVFAGIRAVVRQAFGSDDLAGRSVHVQGVGDVGEPLARLLARAGARLLLSDIDPRRAQTLASSLEHAEVIACEGAALAPCDVYAPCAVGATLNAESIPRLACRAVVGSANNQLETPGDADRLHARGILYGPDYVVNAGGAIAFGMRGLGTTDEEEIARRIDHIDASLTEILRESSAANESPLHAAARVVRGKLGRE